MSSTYNAPRLYTELASWFHLLTAPADYAEEAEFIQTTLTEAALIPIQTVLELGSGGGNNAFHLKATFTLTLVDLSVPMLEVSRQINPNCEHVQGDMCTVRLGREFDAVLIHDAVMYLTTPEDLLACMKTAFLHCRRGGVALLLPDLVRERFVSSVHHGGRDGHGRGLRYIEWTFDPDPGDHTYIVDFAYLLREGKAPARVEEDHHVFGLFSRDEWLGLLSEAGFTARMVQDSYDREVFVGCKPP